MSLVDEVKKRIKEGNLEGDDLPMILDAIVEIANTNEDIKELAEDMAEEGDDVWVNFTIPGVGGHCLEIKGGKVTHLNALVDEPTVNITTDKDTAVGVISGKIDAMEAFAAGKLKLGGNLMKASGLVLLLNVVGDELGLELEP
ncbi:MAG: SCP2 sterol-binding domain-containing protein [Promethearchaeota archaeon]